MIKSWMLLGVSALIACTLSLILTPIARTVMRRVGAVDLPDPRRVNRIPVPRGGGIAVILAFYGALAIAWGFFPNLFAHSSFTAILPWFAGASLLLMTVGLVDDIKGVAPVTKLLAQILVAGILCYGGARLILPTAWGAWVSSPWVYVPLTLAWYIGVINAFNLIDGLDGLSSGLGIIATVGMMGVLFLTDITTTPIICVIFIGALLGFLRYNYNPASVFLGDTGSLFVGLTLATIALTTRRSDAFLVTMGIPILCMGVPLIDTTLAILRRTLRRILLRKAGSSETDGAMTADKDHMHHRLLNLAKGNQRRAVWGLYLLTLALVALGFTTAAMRESKVAIFLLGFIAIAAVIVRFMVNVEFWDAGKLLSNPGTRIGRRSIAIPLYVLADILSMAGTFTLIYLCTMPRLPRLELIEWLYIVLVYAVPVIVGLALANTHTCIWGRSARKDYMTVILAVVIPSIIAHILLAYTSPHARELCVFHILWVALLPLPILASRLLKSSFIQWMAHRENVRLIKDSKTDPAIERILFYGAGINLESYLRIFEINVTTNKTALIGVLDDNRGLKGRVFRSLKILGPLETLDDVERLAELHPTQIMITTPSIVEPRLSQIRDFCQAHHIKLTRSLVIEETLSE